MPLPAIPKDFDELGIILVDIVRRLDNIDGVRGNKLSHKNLKDIDDHRKFPSTDRGKVDGGALLSQSTATTTALLRGDVNTVIDSINDIKRRQGLNLIKT